MVRRLAAVWGIAGVLCLLAGAGVRLFGAALQAWEHPFNRLHWIALGANVLFMAYTEGYRGFQRQFSPRVVARAVHLSRDATIVQGCLAPAFCMGLFHASRRRMMTTWGLTAGIVLLVVLVRRTPQPWRGIIDAGVVVGLLWGVLSLLAFALRAAARRGFDFPADLPAA